MRRLLIIPMILVLFIQTSFAGRYICDDHLNPSIAAFEKQLKPLPKWKRNIIRRLWIKDVRNFRYMPERNRFALFAPNSKKMSVYNSDFISKAKKKKFWLPHALDIPFEVAHSLYMVHKNKSSKVPKDYLVIPGKVLLTDMIERPFTNMSFLLAFGGTGVLLGIVGLSVDSPLFNEIDPDELEENEVIVIAKLDETKVREQDGNIASWIGGKEIEALEEEFPGKIIVLHIDQYLMTNKKNQDEMIEKFHKKMKDKKIKKLLVSSHGTPGRVYSDSRQSWSLSQFSFYLKSTWGISKYLTDEAEVHFDSCSLALNDYGKKQVGLFGESLFPDGVNGEVNVNTYFGIAGISSQSPIDFANTGDGMHDAVTNLVPQMDLIYNLLIQSTIRFAAEEGADKFQKTKYNYKIGQKDKSLDSTKNEKVLIPYINFLETMPRGDTPVKNETPQSFHEAMQINQRGQ